MRTTLLAFLCSIFSLVAGAADSTTAKPPFVGVFSNGAEGFYVKRLILVEGGKGFYQGVPALWLHDPKTNELTITLPPDAPLQFYTFKLRFDAAKGDLTYLDRKLSEDSPPLRRTQAEIPQQVRSMLQKFDGTMKSIQ